MVKAIELDFVVVKYICLCACTVFIVILQCVCVCVCMMFTVLVYSYCVCLCACCMMFCLLRYIVIVGLCVCMLYIVILHGALNSLVCLWLQLQSTYPLKPNTQDSHSSGPVCAITKHGRLPSCIYTPLLN